MGPSTTTTEESRGQPGKQAPTESFPLLKALRDGRNRDTYNKLLFFMAILAVLPIAGFFWMRNVGTVYLGLQGSEYQDLVNVLAAVVLAYAIIGAYVISALQEPDDAEVPSSDSKKSR